MNTIDYLKQKTWDLITDHRIDKLHPKIRAEAKAFIIKAQKQYNIRLRVTSTLRSWEEQSRLYNQGRTTPGKIVTDAKAGESFHNYGLAFDVVEIKNGQPLWNNPNWSNIATLGKSLGFSWGGDWRKPDRPHFQKRFGLSKSQMALLYNSGKRNGNYITLS